MDEEERVEQLKAELGFKVGGQEDEGGEELVAKKKESWLKRGPVIGRGKLKVRVNVGFIILLVGFVLFIIFYLVPLYGGR